MAEVKQNTKINGFRFKDSFVKGLKSLDAFKAAYKGKAYIGATNEDQLLKDAWDHFNPPAETKKAAADSK